MSRSAFVFALLSGVLTPSLGCVDTPDIQWEGEYVIFATDKPDQVCAGTREYLDQRAGAMLERFGSDATKIEYYFVDDVSEYCTLGSDVAGCGEDGVVYSEMVPHLHEIVHSRPGDHMPLVLEEGLASHFGDPYPIQPMAPRERLAELLTSDVNGINSVPDYGRAAHFVTFLSETYGWETLLELDAELLPQSTPEQVDLAFQAVLELDVEGVLAAYAEYPECTGFVDTSLACAEPAIPAGVTSTTHERLVDCAALDGVGPHSGMVFVEDVIELLPSIDGTRIVSATGDGVAKGGFVVLRRCGLCPDDGVGTVKSGPAFVPEQDLPAGRYSVRFVLPIDAGPAVVGVRIDG